MLVEESTVPPTHVTIGQHPPFAHPNHAEPVKAVHVAFLVYPIRCIPVLWRDDFVIARRVRQVGGGRLSSQLSVVLRRSRTHLERIAEGLFIEEYPRVPIFVVPVVLKLTHALHDSIEFFVPHEAYECSSGSRGPLAVPEQFSPRSFLTVRITVLGITQQPFLWILR